MSAPKPDDLNTTWTAIAAEQLSAFQRDSTMNVFSWPEAHVGNEITVEIERSAAPGGTEAVTYTAGLGPYLSPSERFGR